MSVLYMTEEVTGITGAALFGNLYALTLLFFKGTIYICFAILTGIGGIITGQVIQVQRVNSIDINPIAQL